MKLYFFKIDIARVIPFIRLCESLEIGILISWREDGDIFSKDSLQGYIRLYTSSTIPEELQIEKLNEKFGNSIKAI